MSDADRIAAVAEGAVARSTLASLHALVKARCAAIAEDFWGLATKTGQRAPQIFDGYLPPRGRDDEVFPYIIVGVGSGTDSPEGADQNGRAVVDLSIATLSDEDDGYIDLLNLIDAIRESFEGAPFLGGSIELVGPLAWAIPEKQVRPQWVGSVLLTFEIPRPVRVASLNPPTE